MLIVHVAQRLSFDPILCCHGPPIRQEDDFDDDWTDGRELKPHRGLWSCCRHLVTKTRVARSSRSSWQNDLAEMDAADGPVRRGMTGGIRPRLSGMIGRRRAFDLPPHRRDCFRSAIRLAHVPVRDLEATTTTPTKARAATGECCPGARHPRVDGLRIMAFSPDPQSGIWNRAAWIMDKGEAMTPGYTWYRLNDPTAIGLVITVLYCAHHCPVAHRPTSHVPGSGMGVFCAPFVLALQSLSWHSCQPVSDDPHLS